MFAETDIIAPITLLDRVLRISHAQHAVVLSAKDVGLLEPRTARDTLDDDATLVRRIGDGDHSAYRAMVERYLQRIAGFSQRLLGSATEAEDVAQDTFLKLWTEASRLAHHAKPGTWLYRVAHNLCVDRLRKRRPGDDTQLEQQSSGDHPSTLVERKHTSDLVHSALAALPERQRAAISLVHYEGLSNIEAALVLDVNIDALESLLARGRRTLRETLREVHAESEQSQ